MENPEKTIQSREALKGLISSLKDLDSSLAFFFLTGVSKFSKTSLFSALNHLVDLSTSPDFATLLGYTSDELGEYFQPFIDSFSTRKGITSDELCQSLQEWYNGYSWNGVDFVYAPYSVLSALWHQSIENYWFQSGIPSFLLKVLTNNYEYDFEEREGSSALFEEIDPELIHPLSLLFQAGYLILKKRLDERRWLLSYPNKEVKYSLLTHLSAQYNGIEPAESPIAAERVAALLNEDKLEELIYFLQQHFASTPYQILQTCTENLYHAALFTLFSLAAVSTHAEISSQRGRADLIVSTISSRLIIECKIRGTAAQAVTQIRKKGYAEPYAGSAKKIFLIGLRFKKGEGLVDWKVEEL